MWISSVSSVYHAWREIIPYFSNPVPEEEGRARQVPSFALEEILTQFRREW
jgi:hypothetical protein